MEARLKDPPARLNILRDLLTEESVSEFSWSLLDLWERGESQSKDECALLAVLLFGGERTAERLIELIPQWQLRPRKRWVVAGYEVLARIGSPVALSFLERSSRENKDESVRQGAGAAVAQAAAARGLRPHELIDSLVPTFGLGRDLTRSLAYGDVCVRVGFGGNLRPYIVSETGERWKRLPAPSDGSVEAFEQAKATWDGLRKDVDGAVKQQVRRLERAMCA